MTDSYCIVPAMPKMARACHFAGVYLACASISKPFEEVAILIALTSPFLQTESISIGKIFEGNQQTQYIFDELK